MDFEGEYTMRTASNQQSYEPDTVYPDAVLNIARDSASVFQLKRKWEKDSSDVESDSRFPARAGMENLNRKAN